MSEKNSIITVTSPLLPNLDEFHSLLKEIWDSGDCNDCKNGQCEWRPKLGQLVRFNCPHYVGVANEEVNADESNSNMGEA
jgi:hypothetical protein